MSQEQKSRQDLIELVDEFRDSTSLGHRGPLGVRLREYLPGTDVLNLCESDLASDTIIDFCLGFEQTKRILDRSDLIKLVLAIRSPQQTSEADDMLMIETFLFNCHHPAGTDLIYYPDDVFGAGVEVTTEMIVDKALSGN